MREKRFATDLFNNHEVEPEHINFAEKSFEYDRLDELLKRKHKLKVSNNKGKIKYLNPLLDIKVPFIDKSKLVREREIF